MFFCVLIAQGLRCERIDPAVDKAFENREGDLHWQRPSQHMLFVSGNAEILLLREIDALASKNSSLFNLNMSDA